jgi:predicted transcriptional regulator
LGKLCHSLLGAIIGFFVLLQAGYLELLVENLMRQPLKTVSPEISIRNTTKAMLSEKIDALVIKDKSSGKHIEIVTNTDLADLAIAMEINPESPQLKK